jgi:hypothetical protein
MGDLCASPSVGRPLRVILALVGQAPALEVVRGGSAGTDVLVEPQKPQLPTHAGRAGAVPRPVEPVEEAQREERRSPETEPNQRASRSGLVMASHRSSG